MKAFYNLSDSELRTWATTFVNTVAANDTAYGVTFADIQAANQLAESFNGSLESQEATAQAARAAVIGKDAARDALIADISKLANRIKANKNVTAAMIAQAGLLPRISGGSQSAPQVPTNLVARATSNGVNRLKWKANGNVAKTLYLVETRFRLTDDWEIAGITTATSLETTDNPVGEATYYRVSAQRAGRQSAPSNVAVVYGETVAAA